MFSAEDAAARGCSLAIFPEMAVSGYPLLDLLERRSFVAELFRAHVLKMLKKEGLIRR